MIQLKVNGAEQSFSGDPEMPLLWYLRDVLGMTGSKFGCGDGQATRSCVTALRDIAGKEITTVEGIEVNGLHPVQKAWMQINVPQCGYCQVGQIMQAAALLNRNKNPTNQEIDEAMSGNICRCGTYQRIRAAIKAAAEEMA
jgi:isoquinoline 1-oxidoreductase alpha subunit